jgi:ABC-type molybdate transport system substrate-binding protein
VGADAAKAFISYLKTPEAAAVFKAKGVTPIGKRC